METKVAKPWKAPQGTRGRCSSEGESQRPEVRLGGTAGAERSRKPSRRRRDVASRLDSRAGLEAGVPRPLLC